MSSNSVYSYSICTFHLILSQNNLHGSGKTGQGRFTSLKHLGMLKIKGSHLKIIYFLEMPSEFHMQSNTCPKSVK